MPKVSVIVVLGYVFQRADDVYDEFGRDTGKFGRITNGDEFDHMSPLCELDDDTELIIVDRAWPYRWDRVCVALRPMIDRVRYIKPKQSELIDRGFRAASTMRNAGAICATGDIFIFVDDFCRLEADAIRQIKQYYTKDNLLVHPVITPSESRTEVFGGHNPGVYMCTREQFEILRGFEENFDGSYGEEDTDFQERLDLLLRQNDEGRYPKRARVLGVVFPHTFHRNGVFPASGFLVTKPGNIWPPWEFPQDFHIDLWHNKMRCNAVMYRAVYEPEIRSGTRVAGNIAIGGDAVALDRLRNARCSDSCNRCNAADREEQISSYCRFHPDQRIVIRMQKAMSVLSGRYGKLDPWTEVQ